MAAYERYGPLSFFLFLLIFIFLFRQDGMPLRERGTRKKGSSLTIHQTG